MSYDIIRGINFKGGKVNIKAGCNNLIPRSYHWHESPSLTKILQEEGKAAVEKIILREYWAGNFQQGDNIYDKTVKYFKSRLPYTWDNVGTPETVGTEKYGCLIEYTEDQLKDALYDCLQQFKNRDMSRVWILRHKLQFIRKATKRYLFYCNDTRAAKTFKSEIDAWLYYGCATPVLKGDKTNIWYENI